MNRKILFILLTMLIAPSVLFADATATSTLTPKSGKLDFMSGGAVAVTDQNSGYTQKVDSAGAASVMEYPKTVVETIGTNDLYVGTTVVTGAARLSTITFGGPTSVAGDYLLIYDALSATGTPKFDISTGTAKSTIPIVIPGGATFSTGIFAKSPTGSSVATFTYDN